MSRFNSPAVGTKTVNKAGGEAFTQSPEMELVSILLTSFAKDAAYRSADATFKRLKELTAICDPLFVAKAAVYARREFGMRSITHVVASELAKHIGGQTWAKEFYNQVIFRPDDMMEIMSYHLANNGKETSAMKKGFGKAIGKFNESTLAKYRGEGKEMKLIDIINIVHPKRSEKNMNAIAKLVKGDLKSSGTWESDLSAAGKAATSDEEKQDLKKDVWIDLIRNKKIKYLALLRNLRNIIEQAPEAINDALVMLEDYNLIKSSLVMPFQYMTAYKEIANLSGGGMIRNVLMSINNAMEKALVNVPRFEGDTLVAFDVSGSMTQGDGKPAFIGSIFAAVIAKANNADLMTFDGDARYRNYNPADSLVTIAAGFNFPGNSTNFHSIFQRATKKYDRIIILSDMQAWVGHHNPSASFAQYKKMTGANPKIYSFDLAGLGSMQFPETNVYALAGFSDKTMGILGTLDTDKNALINEIKKINFD